MGRAPCCDKANVKKGPWSPEEDAKLKCYIEQYGTGGNWIALPQKAGLKRCGKSCRLRWLNYLRPNIKHGEFSDEEDRIICSLYASIGSRWSIIAGQLQGRTDNDIKNYWNTKLKKKFMTNTIMTTTPNLSNLNNINQNKPYHNNQNQYHFLHHQYPMILNYYSSSFSSPSSLLSHALSTSSIYNNNNSVCSNEVAGTSNYYDNNNNNNNNNSPSNLLSFTECSYNNSSSSLNNTLIHMQNYQQHQLVKDNNGNNHLVFDHEHEHDHDHEHEHHHHYHHQHHQHSSTSDDGSYSIITQISNNQVIQEDQIMYGVHHHQGKRSSNHDDHQHANQIEMIMDQKPSLCVNGSSNIAGMWAQNSHCTISAASKLNYGLEEIKELISTNNLNVENSTYYDGTKLEERDSEMMYHYY